MRQFAQQVRRALPALMELGLEALELRLAPAQDGEQPVRVLAGLQEHASLLARIGRLVPLAPPLRALLLAVHDGLELLEREPEHVLEPPQLARGGEALVPILAVRPRRSLAGLGQEPDLL